MNYDLGVILAVIAGLIVTGLAIGLAAFGWFYRDAHRSHEEVVRMIKAVAGLVVQETGKVRDAVANLK